MVESLYYLLAGILLYLIADGILRQLERLAGRQFEYRSLIFFGLLSGLAVTAFWLIRTYLLKI